MMPKRRDSSPAFQRGPDPEYQDAVLAGDGDLTAFERLYRAHAPRINSLAAWMIGSRDTEDVLQDVFIRAWNKLNTFRGDAAFGTWLHQLAVNVILQHRQRVRVRDDRYRRDDDALAGAQARGGDLALYTEVEAAVDRLSPRAREVFVLHDMEGYKHHEIAEMLGISANTSRWQLHSARASLRQFFE